MLSEQEIVDRLVNGCRKGPVRVKRKQNPGSVRYRIRKAERAIDRLDAGLKACLDRLNALARRTKKIEISMSSVLAKRARFRFRASVQVWRKAC